MTAVDTQDRDGQPACSPSHPSGEEWLLPLCPRKGNPVIRQPVVSATYAHPIRASVMVGIEERRDHPDPLKRYLAYALGEDLTWSLCTQHLAQAQATCTAWRGRLLGWGYALDDPFATSPYAQEAGVTLGHAALAGTQRAVDGNYAALVCDTNARLRREG